MKWLAAVDVVAGVVAVALEAVRVLPAGHGPRAVAALGQVPAHLRRRQDRQPDRVPRQADLSRDPAARAPAPCRIEVGAWAGRTADLWAAEQKFRLNCRHGRVAGLWSVVDQESRVALVALAVSGALVALAVLEGPVVLVGLVVPAPDREDRAVSVGLAALEASADRGNRGALAASAELPPVSAWVLWPRASSQQDLRPGRLTGIT